MTHLNRNDPESGAPGRGQDRRTFLKRSSAAVSAAALAACVPDAGTSDEADSTSERLDEALLQSVGEVVLPGELGTEGRQRAVRAFQEWAEAYEPVAELNHGYGTSELRYGPADPVPAWAAQLEALDLEARARRGTGFADLGSRAGLSSSVDNWPMRAQCYPTRSERAT